MCNNSVYYNYVEKIEVGATYRKQADRAGQPLSDGAMTVMIKKLGCRHKQTAHGFRHLISTALNDKGYESDWIERQLAHGDPDKMRSTYNKAAYVEPRRKMMQDWADLLDRMAGESTSIVQIRRSA